jgi:serine/threonine-protein kinase
VADPAGSLTRSLAEGDIVDSKYRIVRFLGKGAWASVYEGVNVRIGRRVAIKVMQEEASHNPGIIERFEREAQAATRIESEHVVHVFDLGVLSDGRPFIVMELLEGEDLGRQIASHSVTQGRAVFYAIQALRGLADAHAAGVLHRDIKPDNIFLVKTKQGDEIVKIVDFGISKLHSGVQVTNMTQTNTVLGSPVYMSPEQCRGTKQMDHRSDLYSLGVVLFELLSGQVPHRAETFNELMFKIALEDAKSPANHKPDLDPELCDIVMKALARDPTYRYQTAHEFEHALVAWGKKHGLDTDALERRRGKMRISVDASLDVDAGLRATTRSTSEPIIDPSRGSGERAVAATIQPRKTGSVGVGLVLGVLALGVLGGAVFFVTRPHGASHEAGVASTAAPPAPPAAPAAPSASATPAAATTEPSVVTLAPPAPADSTTPAAASTHAGLPAGPAATGHAAHLPPATVRTPVASASPAVTAAPPPTATSKNVVDGRTIRTEF